MTEVFLRRLTPALISFVRKRQDFRNVSIHRETGELERLIRDLDPVGLITEWMPGVSERLLDLGLPTILAASDACYPGVVSVDVDDWQVGAEAAEAFLKAGHRHFACLGNGTQYSEQRIEGFIRSLDAGNHCAVFKDTSLSQGRYSEHFSRPDPALEHWLLALPKPVAVFAVHDPLGRFLCRTCADLGLRVPDQVSIIGANNDEMVCGLSYPMLASVAIPWMAMGELIGQSMMGLIAGDLKSRQCLRVPPAGVWMRHSANHIAVEDPMLERAMACLSERMQEPITIGMVCADLRLSRRQLERKFREYYRCSPWAMLCRIRIDRAKHLLASSADSITRIAEACGFNDPERFAVVFRRVAGTTPSRFRKSIRGGPAS